MNHEPEARISLRIDGGIHGNAQVGVGREVRQDQRVEGPAATAFAEITAAVAVLRRRLDALEGEEGAELRAEAADRLDELDAEAASGRPDAGRLLRIRRWFNEHLPVLAPAVSTAVQPLLAQLGPA
jgi:hypothetical protein